MTRDGRITAAIGCALAFGGYLVAAAALTAIAPGRPLGIVMLVAVAALAGWWTTLPGAALVGLLGWPFYSGFVTHSAGVLGTTGARDGLIAALLVAAALATSAAHRFVARARPVDVRIPRQRRAVRQPQHR